VDWPCPPLHWNTLASNKTFNCSRFTSSLRRGRTLPTCSCRFLVALICSSCAHCPFRFATAIAESADNRDSFSSSSKPIFLVNVQTWLSTKREPHRLLLVVVMVTGSYRSKTSSDGQLPLASLILASCRASLHRRRASVILIGSRNKSINAADLFSRCTGVQRSSSSCQEDRHSTPYWSPSQHFLSAIKINQTQLLQRGAETIQWLLSVRKMPCISQGSLTRWDL